jgi:uncharacterized protein with PhoU and TrkA domain
VRVNDEPGPAVRSLRGIDEALPTVSVLGVRHDEGYFGRPPVDVELDAGDELIVYGRRPDLERLGELGV